MSAYTLPHVTPLTSCWRNSLMRGDGPRASHPRPVRPSSRPGLIVVLNTFLPPLISSTTSGFEALRFASSVIVPVTPAYSFVAAIASRSFCVAAFRSGGPASDAPGGVGVGPALLGAEVLRDRWQSRFRDAERPVIRVMGAVQRIAADLQKLR